jgi:hypothetical protein
MATIRGEYHRFLVSLRDSGAPEDVRRLAQVIWDSMDRIAATGPTRRARSKLIAPLLQESFSTRSLEVPAPNNDAAAAHSFARLQRLAVGPFRGFMRTEDFDLSRGITLVEGANGTGKSSFCEALERAFLGSISEAESKRIDQRQYCNNLRLGRHVAPTLEVSDEEGRVSRLQPNEDAYRFCFVEKNRIDEFARMAARTPADQLQTISTLFGVDAFNDFVRGFNAELDYDLDLVGIKNEELRIKRLALIAAEALIRDAVAQETTFTQQQNEWASRVSAQWTYQRASAWLFGVENGPGRLAEIRTMLDTQLPPLRNVRRGELERSLTSLQNAQTQLLETTDQLRARSEEVSYRQLYEAVSALAAVNRESCPACQTPLTRTAADPFRRATEGIADLEALARLQEAQRQQQESTNIEATALHDSMRRALDAIGESELNPFLIQLPELTPHRDDDWMEPWRRDEQAAWNRFLALIDDLEREDAATTEAATRRAPLIEERNRLEELERDHVRLKTLRDTAQDNLVAARELVEQFELDNQRLIEEAAAEAPKVILNQRLKSAYDAFLPQLRNFMDRLPAQLLQGLGDRAKQIYNQLNRDDLSVDLLHALHLPVTSGEKIELEFAGEPGTRYDALQILSEGHIRCLGLAILIAKNVDRDCPVCVFDDAVNAIDDDHRSGIWRTLFEDRVFGNKQIILTSHAEEFVLRIQQGLGADRVRQDVTYYKFRPGSGDHELVVDRHPPTKNYVILAQNSLQADDKRGAIAHSRRAIEGLTDRLWIWLGRHGHGPIELKLAGPKARFDAHDKCEKLRSALRNRHDPPGLVSAYAALDRLLGVNSNSMEWRSLNDGTHDADRNHEFDRDAVRTLVTALTELDTALATLRNN